MNIVMLGVVLLFAQFTLRFWRVVRQREIRWRLLAVRDQLRWRAIQDTTVRALPEAQELDRTLTVTAACIAGLSLWTLVPFASRARVEQEQCKGEETAPELAEFYSNTSKILRDHFRSRHFVIAAVGDAAGWVTENNRFKRRIDRAVFAAVSSRVSRWFGGGPRTTAHA